MAWPKKKRKTKIPIHSVFVEWMTQSRSAKRPPSLFQGQEHSYSLTFCIWATNAAPLLKTCSDASGSERLLRGPAPPVNTGVGSAAEGSYCWLEGHFPFNTTWQMLSRRLIITRSYKKRTKALRNKYQVTQIHKIPWNQVASFLTRRNWLEKGAHKWTHFTSLKRNGKVWTMKIKSHSAVNTKISWHFCLMV